MYDEYNFKEAVTIESQRIFDTCSERDCITNLSVVLDSGSTLTDDISVVKIRCTEVSAVSFAIDPIQFKSGYFAVDITYTFRFLFDAFKFAGTEESVTLTGTSVWNKRVILYGSKGGTKTFSSSDEPCCENTGKSVNMPKVSVSVVEPIALEARIECAPLKIGCQEIKPSRCICVSLGLFSVIRLTRPVTILIPTYYYELPDRENSSPAESPKEVFGKLDFPTEEFFPVSRPLPTADIPPEEDNEFTFPSES